MSQALLVGEDSFERQVYRALMDTRFDMRESWVEAANRASAWWNCGLYENGVRCGKCGFERFRYRRDCNIRGCRRCWRRLKYRIVSKYGGYLEGVKRSRLRFVTLSYRWSLTEIAGSSVDFLMRACDRWRRSFKWDGALMSSELVEKVGGFWYVHIHGIVMGTVFNYSDMGDEWAKLTGSRDVRFEEIDSVRGLLWYILKYVSKDSLIVAGASSAVEYVGLFRVLYRKKLVRAFGCLRGVGKVSRRNPKWVQSVLGFEGGGRAGSPELLYMPVGFGTNSSVWGVRWLLLGSNLRRDDCPVCGARESWEWFSEDVTTNVNNNIDNRGG